MSGSALRRLWQAALDAALPPSCLTCEAPVLDQGTQCAACFTRLSFIGDPCCGRCGLPLPHAEAPCSACTARPPLFEAARAPLLYDEGAKALLLPFKYADRTELARPLSAHMARAGRALLLRADVLVPVPLHWRRLLRRRYNQAALLARQLAARADRPVIPDALRRLRATRPLGGLSAEERRVAVAGAFAVAPRHAHRIAGRRVLLIDDVLTTGATADACAAALLAAGARAVDVLAAARVPDPRADQP
ncbi:MAG: double zinc ribbon domain-containing protein [Rhodovarius sp.]|nr:double zinc ribbon domain-containing protein [Rhodovarius sp.]MCX7931995.1 double zinc ribbon domain-containing protein [Rhodovarius sp.]MDW8313958.1 double zinc ribbon domain-containing protein [Rhodovarius sp.]